MNRTSFSSPSTSTPKSSLVLNFGETDQNGGSRRKIDLVKKRVFDDLAFEVSGFGSDSSITGDRSKLDLWQDYGVVEYLERKLGTPDASTPEERAREMQETLFNDSDLVEANGDVTDLLYHVAKTKHGKVYIRVVRTLLMNRVLCSDRVSQMTKTYNDIEAVTRLLEEKEKDLELTARIGKELLSHNQKLETTVQELENELKASNEKITQLTYEVGKKTELIQVLTNDVEESVSEEGTPTGFKGVNLEVMQKKISCLEDENKQLRVEFSKLAHETDDCEREEARLVQDIANQLANANMEVDGIAEELAKQKDENRLQHEQIISLTGKLAETELRLANLIAEHDEIGATLIITKDNQNALADELAKFKERYAEVVTMLSETQEQLKKQRKKAVPTVRGGLLFPSMMSAPQPDSLAMELESSLYSESSLDSGIIADRMPPYKKVFETVKSSARATANIANNQPYPRLGSMTTSTLSSNSSGPRMSSSLQSQNKFPNLDSSIHSDSENSVVTDSEEYPSAPQAGMPGVPGATELEAALRRLTPAEVSARRACLSTGLGYNYDYDTGLEGTGAHSPPSSFLPFGCRTPDSIMSTGSSGNFSGFSGNSGPAWRLPEKLQIVKPIEGSQTLHHWTQLATPTLGGLLEDRPGVKTRGGRGLEDLGLEIFTLTDVEEDEEYANPGKLFMDTGMVYTYTNSTVMHPDDHGSSVTQSLMGSRIASAADSTCNSGMNTPRATLSRRNSTSTFSTTLGLAKMLNERGIKASNTGSSSAASTPNNDRSNYTPTSTPCNSPDGTPPNSRPTSPGPSTSRDMTPSGTGALEFLYSGAELLYRTFSGEQPPRPVPVPTRRKPTRKRYASPKADPRQQQTSAEKVGMDHIITGGSSLALQGALYSRRESPMAQLTFLKGALPVNTVPEVDSMASTPTGELPGFDGLNGMVHRRPSMRQRRTPGQTRSTRPDLGQVRSAPVVTKESASAAQSALGTISSLLFGRKGGLL